MPKVTQERKSYHAAWYQANKAKIAARHAAYYEANKAQIAAYKQKKQQENNKQEMTHLHCVCERDQQHVEHCSNNFRFKILTKLHIFSILNGKVYHCKNVL